MERSEYWLTRFVILRLIGIVYAVAFLVAVNQIVPLIGAHGLLPLDLYLQRVSAALGSNTAGFMRLPSIFWFNHTDGFLLLAAWLGLLLSLVVVAGYANMPLLMALWLLYLSFVHAGQDWYGYGWEIQLCETGFLAVFLCPLWDMRPFPKHAPPLLIIILFRWLIFRIMFGAGLIKFRGDEVWRNSTALYYYFEKQPIPGPLTRWFHFLPHFCLKLGVWFNWLAELIAPLFAFGPRLARHVAGVIMILLQLFIMISGNLSFLNWLTVIPALACLDDTFWRRVLPRRLVSKAETARQNPEESKPLLITSYIVAVVLAILSIQPAFNLLSPTQVMNSSFDPLELVNTYGAFGSVGQERLNVVFEGTAEDTTGGRAHWKSYIYKGLPVLLDKRPPQVAPYQLRLDWQMWFASMSSASEYPWTYNLVWKLLDNDPDAIGLFSGNPFVGKPPKFIRATLYRYRLAKPNPQGNYWTRERLGDWLPVLSASDPRLIRYLQGMGWQPRF
jgi:hypothetical protein